MVRIIDRELKIIITILLLQGKTAVVIASIELVFYTGLFVFEYFCPSIIISPDIPPSYILLEKIGSLASVSILLSIITLLFFRLYDQQRLELEEAREEALRLSEVKNAFLSNMSHEIRTPINVMLGMTEMVLRDSHNETVSGYARKIKNAGKMLLGLVSNILDVSKIEAGKFELMEDRYRTSTLIQELFEIGTESVRGRDLVFNIQVDDKLPAELWGDTPRIKQIVSNFLSNATKYTNAGSITLTFSHKESADKHQTVLVISVEDTGSGIEEENLSILFDAFTRIDLPAHRNIDGTGLGLTIAKELTERMNGKIEAKSKYGVGSLFCVEIPQSIVDSKSMGDWRNSSESNIPEESFIAPDAKILVVDDNLENLQTIKALLRRTLARVDMAKSGPQCLKAVRKTDYHIILMDYLMPDMDGIETFRRLREEFPDFNTPVIALTANAIAGTESKFLAEGFTAYITKPVQAKKLEETLIAGLALTSVSVTKRTIYPQIWVTPALNEALKQDLAPCGVSLEEGLRYSSGDLSLLARTAEVFVRNYPIALVKMREAAEANQIDFEKLRYPAHSLKSAAGFIGASDLSSLARMVEKGCENSDSQMIELILPLLYLKWERTCGALSAFASRVRAAEPGIVGEEGCVVSIRSA